MEKKLLLLKEESLFFSDKPSKMDCKVAQVMGFLINNYFKELVCGSASHEQPKSARTFLLIPRGV